MELSGQGDLIHRGTGSSWQLRFQCYKHPRSPCYVLTPLAWLPQSHLLVDHNWLCWGADDIFIKKKNRVGLCSITRNHLNTWPLGAQHLGIERLWPAVLTIYPVQTEEEKMIIMYNVKSQTAWVWILTLPLPSCVTSGNVFTLPVPQFYHLNMGLMVIVLP